ncbi:hypothetical protein F511_25789 [Dorcoceras hygrometricum]|uniref:Uncharacterized protein n=1 Tax=Dorcoceras hygrometricum TaxID=472368 RepID=A0A2Z7CAE9_9LAMI|nr:hypothetical protein F511_25789 [Dorcoceras hygrometricum]
MRVAGGAAGVRTLRVRVSDVRPPPCATCAHSDRLACATCAKHHAQYVQTVTGLRAHVCARLPASVRNVCAPPCATCAHGYRLTCATGAQRPPRCARGMRARSSDPRQDLRAAGANVVRDGPAAACRFDWAVKMRIRPPELETSICDVKYHVSLVGNIVMF